MGVIISGLFGGNYLGVMIYLVVIIIWGLLFGCYYLVVITQMECNSHFLQGNGKFNITVNRDAILEGSYNHIKSVTDTQQLRLQLQVVFTGEKGIDCGGLSR